MSEARIVIKGNLTADPELRFTQSGVAVAGFSIAVNHRKRDANNQWVDDGVSFFKCNAWRTLAENICEHFRRGMYVVVEGSVKERTWEDNDGYERKNHEVTVFEAGIGMTLAPKPQPRRQEPRWEEPPPDEPYEDGDGYEEEPAQQPRRAPTRQQPAKRADTRAVAAKKAAKRPPAKRQAAPVDEEPPF